MDIRLSLSLHYIALATSVWPAPHSVFPHHPTGKMLPPGPWPLATPLWPVVPSHLTNCKGAGQYLDEIRGQFGLDSGLVQQGFAKLFPPLLLSDFFTSLDFVFGAAFFFPQIQIASLFLNSSHPPHIPKLSFLCLLNVSSLAILIFL